MFQLFIFLTMKSHSREFNYFFFVYFFLHPQSNDTHFEKLIQWYGFWLFTFHARRFYSINKFSHTQSYERSSAPTIRNFYPDKRQRCEFQLQHQDSVVEYEINLIRRASWLRSIQTIWNHLHLFNESRAASVKRETKENCKFDKLQSFRSTSLQWQWLFTQFDDSLNFIHQDRLLIRHANFPLSIQLCVTCW